MHNSSQQHCRDRWLALPDWSLHGIYSLTHPHIHSSLAMDIQKVASTPRNPSTRIINWVKNETILAILLFFALTFVIHGDSMSASWRWDDGAHLKFAITHSPSQYFFIPEIARINSHANLTPWNALFYDVNLSLFGMDTRWHYAHLLLIVALGAFLFFAVLRQWLPVLPALMGALTLLLGKPTYHIAAGLMHGHYATGFALSMLAILGWVHYLREGKKYWIALSVASYVLAITCKEVYVPLVMLLPFLPAGPIKQRIQATVPFVLVGIAYVGWRYLMLGALIGGYTQGHFDLAQALHQFSRIPKLLIGHEGVADTFLALLFSFLLIKSIFNRNLNWLLITTVTLISATPLFPLTAFPGINNADRYLFVPWIAISALLANCINHQKNSAANYFLYTIIITSLITIHLGERKALNQDLTYWKVLYQFSLTADKSKQAIFVGLDDDYKKNVLIGARYTLDKIQSKSITPPLTVVNSFGKGLKEATALGLIIFEPHGSQIEPMSIERISEAIRPAQ